MNNAVYGCGRKIDRRVSLASDTIKQGTSDLSDKNETLAAI
jgi:hypothetical protein